MIKLYKKLFWKFKVQRTIFPYNEGWGVVLLRPFNVPTIMLVGVHKDEAEAYAEALRGGV